jgi:DNA-binding GntR family transcriptional regulator
MTTLSLGSTAASSAAPGAPRLGERVRSLGDEVYETLLSQLISLKIAPGMRIAVDALVRELGVSQTPIRAALIRLETEGLVVKTHHVGYSAAPMPSRRRFEQMYELRLQLEPFGAGLAAQRMTDASRQQLAAPSADDARVAYGKFAVLDAQFHSWIAEQSGNELLAEALARLYAHTHLFRLRFHSRVTEEAVTEHARIVQALDRRDADGAQAAMRDHILRSRERMAPFFEMLD